MLVSETLADDVLKVKVTDRLEESDFARITPLVERMIEEHGKIKLLIDATTFSGWMDMRAVSRHFAFVRAYQMKIERVALIAGYAWQHWIANTARIFVHPDIKVFDREEMAEAQAWLQS